MYYNHRSISRIYIIIKPFQSYTWNPLFWYCHSLTHYCMVSTRLESTAFLGALWSQRAQSTPRKAVDLWHMILHSLLYKLHTRFWQIEPNWKLIFSDIFNIWKLWTGKRLNYNKVSIFKFLIRWPFIQVPTYLVNGFSLSGKSCSSCHL